MKVNSDMSLKRKFANMSSVPKKEKVNILCFRNDLRLHDNELVEGDLINTDNHIQILESSLKYLL